MRTPLQNIFNESTNAAFKQQRLQTATNNKNEKFVKAKNTAAVAAMASNGKWPSLSSSEKPKSNATEQLKWASSNNFIPKQPKSQWASQNNGGSSKNKRSRKKKSQKTKELQNLAFY